MLDNARERLHIMHRIVARLNQTPRPLPVGPNMPIKHPSQLHLRHELGLVLNRSRRVVAHKTTIPTNTVRRPGLLIVMLRRPGPWQIAVIKSPVFPSDPAICLPDTVTAQERPSVRGHSEQNLLAVHALCQDV